MGLPGSVTLAPPPQVLAAAIAMAAPAPSAAQLAARVAALNPRLAIREADNYITGTDMMFILGRLDRTAE